MNGRCLTKSKGNISDVDVFIRDNQHEYDVWVTVFHQEQDLEATIPMTIKSNFSLRLLFYLKANVNMSLSMSDLDFLLRKYLKLETKTCFDAHVEMSLEKQGKMKCMNTIYTNLNFTLKKAMNAETMKMGFSAHVVMGLVKVTMISDVQDKFISELEDIFISDLSQTRIY